MDRIEVGFREIKLAAAADSDVMSFTGYGAVFGNVDSYGDVIAKGAFATTIREAKHSGLWPAMLSQHGGMGLSADDMTPIGIWEELSEDDVGLQVKGILAPTTRGIEMHKLMSMKPRPAINGLSIGYVPIKWKMRSSPTEPRRTLEEIKLIEVSPVTFPANTKARVDNVKNEITIRTAERALRDAGFSQSEAKRIVAQGFKAGTHRDDESLDDIAAALRRNLQSLKG